MMRIKYNAELAEPQPRFKCMGVCGCFACLGIFAPPAPSTTWSAPTCTSVRIPSSPTSTSTTTSAIASGAPRRTVTVSYFDRPPYAVSGCICPTVPKLEVGRHLLLLLLHRGARGTSSSLSCPASTTASAATTGPTSAPATAVSAGSVEGVPIFYSGFYPQPENTEAFVAMAHQARPRAAHGSRARCVIDRLRSRGASDV